MLCLGFGSRKVLFVFIFVVLNHLRIVLRLLSKLVILRRIWDILKVFWVFLFRKLGNLRRRKRFKRLVILWRLISLIWVLIVNRSPIMRMDNDWISRSVWRLVDSIRKITAHGEFKIGEEMKLNLIIWIFYKEISKMSRMFDKLINDLSIR